MFRKCVENIRIVVEKKCIYKCFLCLYDDNNSNLMAFTTARARGAICPRAFESRSIFARLAARKGGALQDACCCSSRVSAWKFIFTAQFFSSFLNDGTLPGSLNVMF